MYWAPRGGWALPYITYTGMCRPTGRDFEAPGLERGIHTGTYPPEKYPSAPPPGTGPHSIQRFIRKTHFLSFPKAIFR